MINSSDSNTIQGAWDNYRGGDVASFEMIYDFFFEKLLNYGLKFTQNFEIIEDAIQELFTKLWNNRLQIKSTPSVKNYLYKSFRNTLLDKISSIQKKQNHAIHFEKHSATDFQVSYEQLKIEKETLSELQRKMKDALDELTPRHKEILYLRFYDELSYEEIAEIMHLSTKSTYKLFYRALDKLRDHFDGISFLLFWVVLRSLKN